MSATLSRTAARRAGTLAGGALLFAGCSATAPDEVGAWQPTEQVTTPRGDVRGWTDDDVVRFQRVPYAEPATARR